jgi:hypothetical protein
VAEVDRVVAVVAEVERWLALDLLAVQGVQPAPVVLVS